MKNKPLANYKKIIVVSDGASRDILININVRHAAMMQPNILPEYFLGRVKPVRNQVDESFPLSPFQQAVYFDMVSTPYPSLYAVQTELLINEKIIEEMLKKGFSLLVEKYSILRTIFIWDEKQEAVFQKVLLDNDFSWKIDDLQFFDEENRKNHINKLKEIAKLEIAQVSQLPNLKINLIHLANDQTLLLITQHHLTTDGYSIIKLLEEVFQLYNKCIQNDTHSKIESCSYKSYIEWINYTNDDDKSEKFWKKYIENFDFNGGNLSSQGFVRHLKTTPISFVREKLRIDENESAYVNQFIANKGITLSILVRAAWAIVLSKYCRTQDIIFGFVFSNYPEFYFNKPFLGPCINTVPCRIKLKTDKTGNELLDNIRRETFSLYENSLYPIYKIKTLTDLKEKQRLFDSILIVENYTNHPALEVNYKNFDITDETGFPLVIQIIPNASITIEAIFRNDLLQVEFVREMAACFQHVIMEIFNQPNKFIEQYDLLSEEKNKQYFHDMCSGEVISIKNKTIIDELYSLPKSMYTKTAIIHHDNSINYEDFFRQVNSLASYLVDQNVKQGDIIGVCCSRSIEMIVIIYSILQVGAAYLPIDPAYPAERIAYIIENSEIKLLILNFDFHFTDNLNVRSINLNHINYDEENKFLGKKTHFDSLSYVIYTSGSTGHPKGVMIKHRSLYNLLTFMKKECQFTEKDIMLNVASYAFDLSVPDLFLALINRGTLVLVDHEDIFNPSILMNIINKEKISFIQATPSF